MPNLFVILPPMHHTYVHFHLLLSCLLMQREGFSKYNKIYEFPYNLFGRVSIQFSCLQSQSVVFLYILLITPLHVYSNVRWLWLLCPVTSWNLTFPLTFANGKIVSYCNRVEVGGIPVSILPTPVIELCAQYLQPPSVGGHRCVWSGVLLHTLVYAICKLPSFTFVHTPPLSNDTLLLLYRSSVPPGALFTCELLMSCPDRFSGIKVHTHSCTHAHTCTHSTPMNTLTHMNSSTYVRMWFTSVFDLLVENLRKRVPRLPAPHSVDWLWQRGGEYCLWGSGCLQ